MIINILLFCTNIYGGGQSERIAKIQKLKIRVEKTMEEQCLIEKACKAVDLEIKKHEQDIIYANIRKNVMKSLNRQGACKTCDEDVERLRERISTKKQELARYEELLAQSRQASHNLEERLRQEEIKLDW